MSTNDEALAGGTAQGSRGQTDQKHADSAGSAPPAQPELTRHPLSVAWGNLPADEFAELVQDIKKHGQISDIIKSADGSILDGWHRYRACLQAGVKPRIEPFSYAIEAATEQAGSQMTEAEFVVAQNAHRRHLTQAQRREIVAALLRAEPSKGDRAIGSMAKVDHKTVAAVRKKAEATGEIPQLTRTTGRDGKARRVKIKVERVPAAPREVRFTVQPEVKPVQLVHLEPVDAKRDAQKVDISPSKGTALEDKVGASPLGVDVAQLRSVIISAAQAARFESRLDECAKELRRIGGRTKSRRRASLGDVYLARMALTAALRELPAVDGEAGAGNSIAAAADALAAAFDTSEPIKAADRAAMDKLRKVLWKRSSSLKKNGSHVEVENVVKGLIEQSKKNAATVCIPEVGHLAHRLKAALLDQLLSEASEVQA